MATEIRFLHVTWTYSDCSKLLRAATLRQVDFEWDWRKARANEEKHGVDFEEASEVFAATLASTVADPDHSIGENRHIIFCRSRLGTYLVVSFTDRDGKIRIIDARRMTRRERKGYES